MQTQYLYPSGDKTTIYSISPASFYDLNDFSKSTNSASGYSTYLDEGITTANDNDYIYISGHYQSSGISNPWGRNYLNFDVDNLLIKPSSIALNVRCTYLPDIESGIINVVAYLCNSGQFYTYTNVSGSQYVTGLNYNNIISSSIFTVTSGTTFSNHLTNMIINNVGASSFDKYNDFSLSLGYFYTPTTAGANGYSPSRRNGLFKISAVELIASGEYINNKYMPLEICGGDYLVRKDILLIYHDYSVNGVEFNGVFQKLVPDDEVESITYEYAHDLENLQSPLMCLNYNTSRQDIFRDCFFDFNHYSGTTQTVNFYSSKSTHKLNLTSNIAVGLSGAIYVGRSYSPTGNQLSQLGHRFNEDSFVRFEPYMYGIASGCFPSGDFAMWIGASQLPLNPSTEVEFIRSASGDFSFGISASNRIYADLITSSGTSERVIGTLYNNSELGVLVNYDFNGLSLYKMIEDGRLINLDNSDSFDRISYAIPSGDLIFNLSPSTFPGLDKLDLNLYEFGVVSSGLSNSDLTALSRYRLFDSIHDNTLQGTIVSGDSHIVYRSLEDRISYSSTLYSGDFFNFGRYKVGADNYATLIPSIYDSDMNNVAIRNKYPVPYVDITENCFLSGTTNLFFQDGTLYFSGWIDAATTNPSGFLQNNLFVRVLQDKSRFHDIPNQYYDFDIPGASSTIVSVFSGVGISDGNYDSFFQYTKSANSSSGLFTYVDEVASAANDLDWISISGSSTGSGFIGFGLGNIGINTFNSGLVSFRAFSDTLGHRWLGVYLLNGSGQYPFTNVVASSDVISAGYDIRILQTFNAVLNPVPAYQNTNLDNAYLYFSYFKYVPDPGIAIHLTSANMTASGGFTQVTSETENDSDFYTSLTEANGKVAAGTTTLRSGLNEYLFPLEKSLYRFDLYQNQFNPFSEKVVHYDKTSIEHIDWDGADVSLYFASYSDAGNSGYIDTLKFYTSAIIAESWSAPAEYLSGICNLATSGVGFSEKNQNLFLCSNFSMSGIDLYLHAGASASGIVSLYTAGGLASSGTNLFLGNYQSGTTAEFTMFTFAEPYPSSNNSTNLYINSSNESSIINSLNMTIHNSGYSNTFPLFLKCQDSDQNYNEISMVVWNDTTAAKYLDLFLNQNTSSIFSSQRLFVGGAGLYDGAKVGQSGHTMFIGSGPDLYYSIAPLFISGPSGITDSLNMMISGGSYINNSMNLVIASSTGFLNDSVTLFSHGF